MHGETESGNPLVELETGSYTAISIPSLAVHTTTTTANLPEFNLGARTHKTSINSTKLGKSAEKLIQPSVADLEI